MNVDICNELSLEQIWDILCGTHNIVMESRMHQMDQSASYVRLLGDNNIPIYGITTGFGQLINRLVPSKHASDLSKNLILTHSTGAGQEIHPFFVRAMMLSRLANFAKGHSGIQLSTIGIYNQMFNDLSYPLVHEYGSLGASGDLSPMSEIALPLVRENDVRVFNNHAHLCMSFIQRDFPDTIMLTDKYLHKLTYKEGLSLINGTCGMTGIALVTCKMSYTLLQFALVATTFSIAAMEGSNMPFNMPGVSTKLHKGMQKIASAMNELFGNGSIFRRQENIIFRLSKQISEENVVKSDEYLQNAYSMRCIPQVLGAVLEILEHSTDIVLTEFNGVNDNPVIMDDYVYHGAHFHGQYVGFAMDNLKTALIQMANLSERRVARLIDANYSGGLPDLLAVHDEGLQCAFEGLQYTATSICAEMRAMATPASIQNIPSNLNNQDLVSMGMIAARQCYDVMDKAYCVIAVELMTALQAVEIRMRLKNNKSLDIDNKYAHYTVTYELLGEQLAKAYNEFRESGIEFIVEDRYLKPDLDQIMTYMRSANFFISDRCKDFLPILTDKP